MNNFDLELKTIQLQNEKLLRGLEEVHKMLESVQPVADEIKQFYTIEDCWRLKGGCALNTLKTNRTLLPGAGAKKYSAYIGGRLCFPRDEVMRWLKVTDADYVEYAKSCGVTILPEKYTRLVAKAKQGSKVAV